MSFKSSVVKMAIKMTPDILVKWIANLVLKGIAEFSEFNFDIDARTAYVQLTLYGEAEPIEIWIDGFGITSEEDSRHMLIRHARSNRPWMDNLLNRFTGKAWRIPALPQFQSHLDLVTELLQAKDQDQEQDT